jgi:hypothetical protein
MKSFFTLLFSIFLGASVPAQNGLYVFGQLDNAPGFPVEIQLAINSNPAVTHSFYTEQDGTINTFFIETPSAWDDVYAFFVDCNDTISTFYYQNPFPTSIMDVYLDLDYCDNGNSDVYGCTDSTAINYNPNATIDNGTCQYASTCDFNEVVVMMSTQIYGAEISWNLFLDSSLVYTGQNYSNNFVSTELLCLEDGCYTLEMLDSFGDGWNGAQIMIQYNGMTLFGGSLQTGDFGMVQFGLNTTECEPISVYGCTDPMALNYNPLATTDDSTCVYPQPVVNDLCVNATALIEGIQPISNQGAVNNENIWGECWAFGAGEGEQSSIWFTFTTPSVPATIHIEAMPDGTNSLTDTQFGIFESCGGEMIYCDGNAGQGLFSAFTFACGELELNTTYILMIDGYYGDSGTCLLEYEVDTTCVPLAGCTDVTALNYNPSAIVDDGSCVYPETCETNLVQLTIQPGTFPTEIDWHILDSDSTVVAYGDAYAYIGLGIGISLHCLEDGCYTFEMFDSFGDGWNGGGFLLTLNDSVIANGTLNQGYYGQIQFGINTSGCETVPEVFGCTDPNAINYNPLATIDNGTCTYQEICDANLIQMSIQPGTFPNEISWNILDSDSMIVAYGDADGSNGIPGTGFSDICLEDGCYTLEMFDIFGDGWNGGSFQMILDSTLIASGTLEDGFYGQIQFGVNTTDCATVYGCTDASAINYNPLATEDDGSCEYQFECSINFTVIPDTVGGNVIWIVPSENINQAAEVTWDFGDGTTSNDLFPSHTYAGDGPYTLCVTAFFNEPNGGYCSITYCAVLTYEMLNPPGMVVENGFTINIVNNSVVLSTNELEQVESIKLWPNPVSSQVFLSYGLQQNSNVTIKILDVTGKLIQSYNNLGQAGINNFNFNVESLNAGMYFVEINTDSSTSTSRFIVK